MNKWIEINESHLYYDDYTGRIIGQAHRLGVSGPWYLAKICQQNTVEFSPIGNYIDLTRAKIAVENYWFKQKNTLDENKLELLDHGNV